MNKSLKLQDYHRYNWTPAELAAEILKSAGVVILLAYFFYRSVWAILPLSFIGVCFFKADARQKAARRKAELCMQFKECILSMAASLRAGYAVENAFVESRNDIRLLYGEASPIYAELEGIRRGLVINLTLEELLIPLDLNCLLLFSCQVMSDSLCLHGLQHARPLRPSPSPRFCPSSCPLHQ